MLASRISRKNGEKAARIIANPTKNVAVDKTAAEATARKGKVPVEGKMVVVHAETGALAAKARIAKAAGTVTAKEDAGGHRVNEETHLRTSQKNSNPAPQVEERGFPFLALALIPKLRLTFKNRVFE